MCQYEDVRVLWDMLTKADVVEVGQPSMPMPPPENGERRNACCFFEWARRRI